MTSAYHQQVRLHKYAYYFAMLHQYQGLECLCESSANIFTVIPFALGKLSDYLKGSEPTLVDMGKPIGM